MRRRVQTGRRVLAGADRRCRAAVMLPALLLALMAGLAIPRSAGSAPSAVQVAAKEFTLIPKDVMTRPGDVTLVVRNEGEIEHNLVVESAEGRTLARLPILEPGETGRIHASLAAGTYILYCSLPGHREAGMVATLHVGP
jgi:uncharacterized cupredoxin-like copper-binding protein